MGKSLFRFVDRLENFMDYQILINFLFTFIVVVFHYQMLHRKKKKYIVEYL